MSHPPKQYRYPLVGFLFENSIFLIAGTVLALLWANLDNGSYQRFIHFDVRRLVSAGDGESAAHESAAHESASGGHAENASSDAAASHGAEDGTSHGAEDGSSRPAKHATHGLTIHLLVNDLLMALFFAIAGKEVWESFLPNGALSNPRKAATPLLATLGGIIGPAGLYLAGAAMTGNLDQLGRGWAVPCATDIAFSYLVARLIFGVGHPAIAFLLLLAIADDAAGLVILAIAYPQKPIEPIWFLLTGGAIALAFGFRKLRLHSFWWYLLIPGVLSWFSFYKAGIHAALGVVPIIPAMPHAFTDLGIFARQELSRQDTLNEFEHWWKNPVELILGLFGLTNAGVVLSSVGTGTYLVLIGLVVGKPLGITLFTWIAEKGFKLEIPAGMNYRHIVTLGSVAGIGFTVALFVSEAAFPAGAFPDALRDAVKMGALGSFFAGAVGFIVGRALGIRPNELLGSKDASESGGEEAPGEPALAVSTN